MIFSMQMIRIYLRSPEPSGDTWIVSQNPMAPIGKLCPLSFQPMQFFAVSQTMVIPTALDILVSEIADFSEKLRSLDPCLA